MKRRSYTKTRNRKIAEDRNNKYRHRNTLAIIKRLKVIMKTTLEEKHRRKASKRLTVFKLINRKGHGE